MREPKVGAQVKVKTAGMAQRWTVVNITNTKVMNVTNTEVKKTQFENSEITVDKSWFVFDVTPDYLVLQQLGILRDMVLKHTTNP